MHTFGLDSNQGTAVLLQKEKSVGEKEPIQSSGTEQDARLIAFVRYVIRIVWYTYIYAFYTLPPTYYRKHTEKKPDLITRNLKGKNTLDCCVLYTFNDLTIYSCIKSSEKDVPVPSLPATGMTSQGMLDNYQ